MPESVHPADITVCDVNCGRSYERGSVTETPFQLKGIDWLLATAQERERLLEFAFTYWRRRGFPHYHLSRAEIAREFECLVRYDPRSVFVRRTLRGSPLGLRLANSFHPSMWSVRVSRYRSPMDVYRDDELLRSAIGRALTIWPSRFAANASCLRRILKTFPGAAGVSNFKPTVAKAIVDRFSPPGGLVVDFCAGFGGRLLGCLTLPRSYFGIEPSSRQVHGLKRMIRTIEESGMSPCRARIEKGCAEELMQTVPARSVDLVFSSPPYFNWEKYSTHETQSFIRYRAYKDWLNCFLKPVISQSGRVLKASGHLVLNVSDRQRAPSSQEVVQFACSLGFSLAQSYRMVLPKVPYLHPRNGHPEKCERVLVFSKRVKVRA